MADKKVSDLPSLNGADVDPADLLYIVDSSAGAAGSKKITVGQYQLAPVSGGTANTVVYLNGSKVESSSSALTFDGTNLGVGTSSPAQRLDVTGAVNSVQARFGNVAGRGLEIGTSIISGTNDAGSVLNAKGATSGTMIFQTDSTERMRLDSSGNLGLGVTPSAWGSNFKAFESAGNSSVAIAAANINGINIASNTYNDNTNWIYKTTGAAARYSVNTGVHQWYTAPSGTAGNAISFTQAMTLDASGNLLVGKTATTLSEKFAVKGTGSASVPTNLTDLSGALMMVESNKAGTGYGAVGYNDNGGGGAAVVFGRGASYDTNILFCTNPSTTTTSGAMTERARITSGGDLLVGTTGNANNYKTHILTTGAGAAIGIFQNNATTPYGINVYYGAASPNNSNANTSFLYCNDLTTLRIQLASNGGVINYQANDSNLSDRREKTDFAPAKSYLDTICAIPVQTFKYIDQTDDAPTLGVVAQDVQAVAPELVMESNWGTEDNPKMRLSIYQTDLQYALMKCIQEQQELIKDLRARVAALEAK